MLHTRQSRCSMLWAPTQGLCIYSLVAVEGNQAEVHIAQERDWPAVAPDVILQLGGHLTSKRLGQFLDWAALGGDSRRAHIYILVLPGHKPAVAHSGADRQRPRLPASSAWATQSICSYRRQLRRRVAAS